MLCAVCCTPTSRRRRRKGSVKSRRSKRRFKPRENVRRSPLYRHAHAHPARTAPGVEDGVWLWRVHPAAAARALAAQGQHGGRRRQVFQGSGLERVGRQRAQKRHGQIRHRRASAVHGAGDVQLLGAAARLPHGERVPQQRRSRSSRQRPLSFHRHRNSPYERSRSSGRGNDALRALPRLQGLPDRQPHRREQRDKRKNYAG